MPKANQCESGRRQKAGWRGQNNFVQKCLKTDAAADKGDQCEGGDGRKLAGAAKNSFIQKCVKTA